MAAIADVCNTSTILHHIRLSGSSEPDSRIWCTQADVTMLADSLIAAATDNADNYLLQELVEELELSSELFAA